MMSQIEVSSGIPSSSMRKALLAADSPTSFSKSYLQSKSSTSSSLANLIAKIHLTESSERSQKVIGKLNKLIKTEKRTMKLQEDLIREVNFWKDEIPNEDSKEVLSVFGLCVGSQREIEEELIQKQENLKLQLISVNKRESKANIVRSKRNKLHKMLREQESKIAESSSITLMREHLEELNISVEVVDEQYTRCINSQLRSSITNYLLSLSMNTLKMKHDVDQFLSVIVSLSTSKPQRRDLYPFNTAGMVLKTAELGRFQNSQELIGSEINSGGSETPISMNPLNQGENKPSNSNYINILRNQLQQRSSTRGIEPVENNADISYKGEKSSCNLCNHRDSHCDHRVNGSGIKKTKERHGYNNPILNGNDRDFTAAEHDLKRKLSRNSFPGGLGLRFPSSMGNQDLWKR